MVRVRRANQGTRRTPSIRETSRRIRRNRRTRRLPHIIVLLDNEIIEPIASTVNQFSFHPRDRRNKCFTVKRSVSPSDY